MNFDGVDLPLQVEVNAIGGTKLEHIRDRIEQCEVDSKDIRVVVLHVGSCEWSSNAPHPASADTVYRDYIEALTTISDKYPQAELALSGIPPRVSKGQHKNKASGISTEVSALNHMLSKLSIDEQNIIYIDNDTFLKDKSSGLGVYELYSDTVHLNPKGRDLLRKSIIDGIREGYAKNGLRVEWNIAHTHS